MSKYRVSAAKPLSAVKKYEFLRSQGVRVQVGDTEVILKGQELDDYLNEHIWRLKHPGQDPIKEWSDDLPA